MNGKKGLKNGPEKLNRLVKNIYRTLMSRGMKGCYVFAVNKDVQQYLESRLNINNHYTRIIQIGIS